MPLWTEVLLCRWKLILPALWAGWGLEGGNWEVPGHTLVVITLNFVLVINAQLWEEQSEWSFPEGEEDTSELGTGLVQAG